MARSPVSRRATASSALGRGCVWAIGPGGLARAADADESPLSVGAAGSSRPLVLVPSEEVLLLSVHLPLASHRRRAAALPYAIEEDLAEPLERLHLVLGAALGDNRYLAAAVSNDAMQRWTAELDAQPEAAFLRGAALLPDALLLPRPAAGSWAVSISGSRALVRSGDGTGFAIPAGALSAIWTQAGRPPVIPMSPGLPPEMAAAAGIPPEGSTPAPSAHATLPIDLRQGRYTARQAPQQPLWRRAGAIAAAGIAAHLAIAAGDTAALADAAASRRTEAAMLIAQRTGVAPDTHDPATVFEAAAALLPPAAAGPADVRGPGFEVLTARALTALAALGADVRVRELHVKPAERRLAITLTAVDRQAFERAVALSQAAGFRAAMAEQGPSLASAGAGRPPGAAELSAVLKLEAA